MVSPSTPYVRLGSKRGADTSTLPSISTCRFAPYLTTLALVLAFACWKSSPARPPEGVAAGLRGPTELWTWGGAWGLVASGVESTVNKTESAAQQLQSSSLADRIRAAARSAASAAQQLQNSSAAQGAEQAGISAIRAADRSAGAAAQRMQNDALVQKAEQVAMNLTGAARREAAMFVNDTYYIPPLCLDAMEIACVVAVGGAASPALLEVIGFTSEGVVARSLASLWQSMFGDVEKGSLFARLQSAGATGMAATEALKVTGMTAAAAAGFCKAVWTLRADFGVNQTSAVRTTP